MKLQLHQDGVWLYESALFRTVTTIVEGEDYLLLVDPNWLPQEVEYLAETIGGMLADRKLYLLFTHSDYDHIIGYERFPDATTIASLAFTSNPEVEKTLGQIRDFDDAYYLSRSYPITYPKIDLVVEGEGTTLTLGDNEAVVFYQAPGHNPDGLLTFMPQRGILIVGDYLSNIEFPYLYHGVAEYRQTLARLRDLIDRGLVKLLVTGHGDATTSLEEMTHRLVDSHTYLDDLEQSIRTGVAFDLKGLFQRYRFPKVMGEFHAGNVKLMKEYVAANPA